MKAVMPFFTASTPARTGVVRARRARAAAGPVVGAGRPREVWLKRRGLERLGRVDQPYFTGRGGVEEKRRAEKGCGRRVVVGVVVGRWICRQQRAGSRGAIVKG
jgi:hypothetical protein